MRRAVVQSINRQGIDAVFFAEGELASQLLPGGEVGHSDTPPEDAFGFDPASAQQLLAEGGYEPGELSHQLIGFPSSSVPEINQVKLEFLGVGIDG